MKREWPADWPERVRGKECPMCAVGQPGYSIVIWRGRHVSDPTELSRDEASAYFDEVLRGGARDRAAVHDGEPGHPAHFMRADLDPKNAPLIAEQTYARDLASLRELLRD